MKRKHYNASDGSAWTVTHYQDGTCRAENLDTGETIDSRPDYLSDDIEEAIRAGWAPDPDWAWDGRGDD